MAYLNAALLASQQPPRAFDPIWDAGMPAFRNYSQPERYVLLDSYSKETGWYADARRNYIGRMAQTVGLVCTAAEAQPITGHGSELVVGTGLAARGVAAVVRHELTRRIGIMEARYAEGSKHTRVRWSGEFIKNGPAEALAVAAGFSRRPEYTDEFVAQLTGDITDISARQLEVMGGDHVPLETAALTVIQGVVSAQTDLERGVYTQLPIDWQPQAAVTAR
jgi:hypothetical protein